MAVENVSIEDYESKPECFPETQNIFRQGMEMFNPVIEKISLPVALANIPLTIGHIYKAAQGKYTFCFLLCENHLIVWIEISL